MVPAKSLGVLYVGLEFDLGTKLLHIGVERVERLRQINIVEVVVVEHAAAADGLATVGHDLLGEGDVAVALSGCTPKRIDREHQPRFLPRRIIRDRVAEAIPVSRVVEARGFQWVQHAGLDRHDKWLCRVRHALRNRHFLDQRPLVVTRRQLVLQVRPGLPIGGKPEAPDDARRAVVSGLDRIAADVLGPVRRLVAAPDPELHTERLLRIFLVVGAHLRQCLVDGVSRTDLRVGRWLQLAPGCDHDEAAKNSGLGIELVQRVDRVAAGADKSVGAHRDEAVNRRLDVLGLR